MCVPWMDSFPEARLSLSMHVNLFDNRSTNYFPKPESLSSPVTTRGTLIAYDGQWPEIQYSMKPARSHSGSRADPVPFSTLV